MVARAIQLMIITGIMTERETNMQTIHEMIFKHHEIVCTIDIFNSFRSLPRIQTMVYIK